MVRKTTRRAGFTFVELLMVIAIILVMASLLLGAVTRVLGMQAKTETLSDMTQMTQSLNAAKSDYFKRGGIEYFPSRLILYNNVSLYNTAAASNTPYAKQTAGVLRGMFGK